jgi:4-methyl-5(b-hydroxyethyl)-thiazole monophosphate biosynthesis
MKVFAFLTDGFETVEALAVIDILRRAEIDVKTVSITGSCEVTSAQNIQVKADSLLEDLNKSDLESGDVLFLPGGPGHKSYMESEKLLDLLRSHNEKGGRLAAICAAPSILGRLGLLKGKKAMCFPGFEKYLEGADVVSAPARVVTDGNITTSRGMGTSIDLGLELVRLIKGENVAASLAVSTQYK